MQTKNLSVAIICFGICLFMLPFAGEVKGQQKPTKITVGEITLRKKAIKTVIPRYPKEAIKANISGVAVSEIAVAEDGTVADVKVLESPHQSINDALIEALKQWKFSAFTIKGVPQKVSGKITFYFVLENNKPKIESPY
jgi:TonB family protein